MERGSNPKVSKWLWIILGIVIIIAVFYFSWYFLKGPGKKVTSTSTPVVVTTTTSTAPTTTTPTATSSTSKTKTSTSASTNSTGNSTSQSNQTPATFAVTAASVTADATCSDYTLQAYPFSTTFHLTGTITANAAGTVTYKWQPTPGFLTSTQSLTFTGAGTKAVNPSELTLTLGNWQVDYAYGSMWLKVFTPNVVSSNTVNVTLNNDSNNIHPCP